jgi:hypothetical protein
MSELQGLNRLMKWTGSGGYISSAPKEEGGNYMAAGSENAMLTGTGKVQAHKGVTQRASVKGGFAMHTIDETYASVGQASDTTGFGNVMKVFAALFYIGKGLVRLAGLSLAVNASATLSLLIKRNGFVHRFSGMRTVAGRACGTIGTYPRAVTPPAGMTGKVTGTVSAVTWRIRSTTGAVSNQSPVSNIVEANGESLAITFPLTDANGQDAWGIGVTKQIEGRTGSHFQLLEIMEEDLIETESRTDVVTNSASLNVSSATGGFTSDIIGWTADFSGGTPACVHSSYVTDVVSANILTLESMPPTTSTGVTMLLTNAVEGTERTYVFEYRDGDLVGREFAPKRNYPPPSGLFAITLEDVLIVDGAYADAEAGTSSTNRGTGIAPSEPGQPEAFSPDTVIFTRDTPTALIEKEGAAFRFTRNKTYAITYLGGSKPISVEPVWDNIGILYQHQAVIGEGGRLYVWSSTQGLLRMGADGMPESEWADAVLDDLIACTDPLKRVLGWHDTGKVVAVCYDKTVRPFFSSLGRWGAPATFSEMANIRSAITENNQLLLVDTNDDIWEYNVGTGTVLKVRTPWMPAVGGMDTIALVTASMRADNDDEPVTVEVFADGDETTAASTIEVEVARTGYQTLPSVWPNVTNCESHQIQLTTTSTTAAGDHGIESIEVFGEGNDILA